MRTRWIPGVCLAALLGACSPMRQAAPPELAGPPAPPPPATPAELGCLSHPSIDRWERRLRQEGPRLRKRGAPYLPRLRQIVTEAGLPPSLALLPGIESSFDPRAVGPTGSRGLWQLEKPTARRFGLVVSRARDDRVHPERSTRAAARYLRFLHRRYGGDWPLALAAYNAGEGRIDRVLARSPGSSFWELAERRRLPAISRDYVPRFLGLLRVVEPPPRCS